LRTARLLQHADGLPPKSPVFVIGPMAPSPAWDAGAVRHAFVSNHQQESGHAAALIDRMAGGDRWSIVEDQGYCTTLRRTQPVPRARVVHAAHRAADSTAALHAVVAGTPHPLTATVVETDLALPARSPAGATGTARFVADTPDVIDLDVETSHAATLVLADAWTSGWSATVDGAPVPIVHADYAFRGVPVPAGRHTVQFRYTPPGLPLGVAISLLALLALTGWWVWDRRDRIASEGRRAQAEHPGAAAPA
jgi:hypothetical protein